MLSSIKIDFRSGSKGIEPIISVHVEDSDDPRDKLIKTLFQSAGNHLRIRYGEQREKSNRHGLPELVKEIYLEVEPIDFDLIMATADKDSDAVLALERLQQKNKRYTLEEARKELGIQGN